MAAASGQQKDTKTKKEVTPQQRKLFMGLGAVGVFALLTGGLFMSGVLGGGAAEDTGAPTAANAAPAGEATALAADPGGAGAVAPGIDAAAGAVAPGAAAATSTVTSVPQAVQRFRSDPFQQAYFIPTPVPTLPPPPPPVDIPSPSDIEPVFLPGVSGGNAELQRPLNLPPVRISRLDEATRRPSGAFPPRRTSGGPGGASVPDPAYDKRLSGVVIADGVHAILEIQGPTGPVSHVVQPGDEVDGITVLNIQRFNDGARTVTRMLIRENGEERTVELRAGAPVAPAGGGFPGGPGGFPGGPQGP
jgi:hypothetical protein